MPFRFDPNGFGCELFIYVREDISCKQLNQLKLSNDMEGTIVKSNLR